MQHSRPWYKEFWPWFLLAILAMSIAMGTTFLVLSITSYDGLVEDNYYKKGLAINEVLDQEQHAAELNMAATLSVDNLTGDVVIELEGDERPEQLKLNLIFPSQGRQDQSISLQRVRDGHYVGQLPQKLNYRWYVQLQPVTQEGDPAWRLNGEAHFPLEAPVRLSASSSGT
ncbi:FixH family protein [Halomonas shantousis]